ncbi:uncharacterized protein FIESC28_07297 [Fusarium coffeatum]|uniref:Apple domain-containing protein n=1 Tax=Fusarium coffeatum TaxID=231269 RepID=A0A366RGX5_9HYPO|nr:uncharacterized protein FIESC28_07297 [Fusarium coffeatum]RBR15656.1 hypothetical protein FIESC28_07297 [Fusarium coffeatum]
MVQINILAGSLALFVISVNAGPTCHPSVRTAVTSTSLSTTETSTAAAATTSAAPDTCTVESPQYGITGKYEVYRDTVASSTVPVGSFSYFNTLVECLDHCDDTPGCQGVNHVTTGIRPMCIIWSKMGSFGEMKGVTAARSIGGVRRWAR